MWSIQGRCCPRVVSFLQFDRFMCERASEDFRTFGKVATTAEALQLVGWPRLKLRGRQGLATTQVGGAVDLVCLCKRSHAGEFVAWKTIPQQKFDGARKQWHFASQKTLLICLPTLASVANGLAERNFTHLARAPPLDGGAGPSRDAADDETNTTVSSDDCSSRSSGAASNNEDDQFDDPRCSCGLLPTRPFPRTPGSTSNAL